MARSLVKDEERSVYVTAMHRAKEEASSGRDAPRERSEDNKERKKKKNVREEKRKERKKKQRNGGRAGGRERPLALFAQLFTQFSSGGGVAMLILSAL